MSFHRECAACGKAFTAESSRARYCSSSCRVRVHRGTVVPITAGTPRPTLEGPGGVERATVAELARHDRVEQPVGVAAVLLARVLDDPATPPGAKAGAAREFRATLAEALKGAGRESSLDDLRRRRDARRAGL